MHRSIILIILISTTILTTSCIPIKSPDQLIKKPIGNIKDTDIVDTTSKYLGMDKVLTLPSLHGKSTTLADINGNGKKNLCILYREKENLQSQSRRYGLQILAQYASEWHEINQIYSDVKGFESIYFDDITGDKVADIIFTTSGEVFADSLYIYTYQDGYFHSLPSESAYQIGIFDIDNDGVNELISMVRDEKKVLYNISIHKYTNGNLEISKSVDFYDGYINYMTIGKVAKGVNGIYLDSNAGSTFGHTSLLVYENDMLSLVSVEAISDFSGNIKVSKDINNDGILEFSRVEDGTIHWYQWDGAHSIIKLE